MIVGLATPWPRHNNYKSPKLRALETGRYILYATTTGITAIITPQGSIQQQLPANTQAVLNSEIIPHARQYPANALALLSTANDHHIIAGIALVETKAHLKKSQNPAILATEGDPSPTLR